MQTASSGAGPQSMRSWASRSLILKITLPAVALVLGVSLVAAVVVGVLSTQAHEELADRRARRFGLIVNEALAREVSGGSHADLSSFLEALCGATGKRAFLTDPSGQIRFACGGSATNGSLQIPDGVERIGLVEGEQRWTRRPTALRSDERCQPCHAARALVGHLVVDTSADEALEEVRDQQRVNLIVGAVMAAAASLLLALVQLVVVYRPVRAMRRVVDRFRSGDLGARAEVGADEIGQLALALNEMAASIQQAEEELGRTHRAELAQAEKLAALGQLTSSIAHEIKNPLSGIIGALKVVEAEASAADPNKIILAKILAQMERLSKTAVELLEFSRPLRPNVCRVDVADIVERAVFFIERQAMEQRVELRKRYTPGLPALEVDPDLMKQVFLNLLLNGAQAMPRGGALTIETRAAGESAVEVVVSDQGIGIPSDSLERIFSPFFSTKTRGTGLGLYVARQIVETQRGEIRVESQLGHGTSFIVRLPAAQREVSHVTG